MNKDDALNNQIKREAKNKMVLLGVMSIMPSSFPLKITVLSSPAYTVLLSSSNANSVI
ncbi:hypothetical protein [Calorimonas adulescens]|uniref:hypothetical protein n=1 Tax=Calorimonas adulescens TaxID=2606906 RepID=UPI0013969267|nr:hypothetical protein [Calorimonas adulescens]